METETFYKFFDPTQFSLGWKGGPEISFVSKPPKALPNPKESQQSGSRGVTVAIDTVVKVIQKPQTPRAGKEKGQAKKRKERKEPKRHHFLEHQHNSCQGLEEG